MNRHDPRLVTVKLVRGMPNLRTRPAERRITACIRAAQRGDFRIVHYSIQSNHLHLIVEAEDGASLASGMKGLLCRIARGLNRWWRRRGALFAGRFHDRALRSMRQLRNALVYVLNNHRKHDRHARRKRATEPDPYSSGRYFDGWEYRPRELEPGTAEAIVAKPCWKIRVGWKRHYDRIPIDETPA